VVTVRRRRARRRSLFGVGDGREPAGALGRRRRHALDLGANLLRPEVGEQSVPGNEVGVIARL
jgi:hypothetical protein